MTKSDITNILTLLLLAYGYSNGDDVLFYIGLFAFSGAITNTLAIHMLFERVPYLYGSGVIERKFGTFKHSIYNLFMNEFFTKEKLQKFFESEVDSVKKDVNFEKVLDKTDFEPAYDSLKASVMESSFGGMLGMFGGEAALEPLKEPFKKKLKLAIIDISKSDEFTKLLDEALKSDSLSDDIHGKLSKVVSSRLDELTPKMVKKIVSNMIHEHLGWLVIWGAVFGGIIGFISSTFI